MNLVGTKLFPGLTFIKTMDVLDLEYVMSFLDEQEYKKNSYPVNPSRLTLPEGVNLEPKFLNNF